LILTGERSDAGGLSPRAAGATGVWHQLDMRSSSPTVRRVVGNPPLERNRGAGISARQRRRRPSHGERRGRAQRHRLRDAPARCVHVSEKTSREVSGCEGTSEGEVLAIISAEALSARRFRARRLDRPANASHPRAGGKGRPRQAEDDGGPRGARRLRGRGAEP